VSVAAARPNGTALQAWKMAVRLPTLTAAVAPVIAGTALAIHDDAFRLLPALAALIGAVALQVGANFANDVFDFERGADTADRLGPPRAAQLGLLSPSAIKLGMWAAFAVAMLAGIYLTAVAGWPIVAVGLASIAGAIIYTGGPWPIGYHALGDVFTFVFFGLVATIGTYFVQAKELTWPSCFIACSLGCTVTMILVVNNLRDIETDRRVNKRTLGVVMGDRATRWWYTTLMVAALVVPIGLSLAGELTWAWLASVAAVPLAIPLLRAILGGTSGRELNPVLKATARFHLLLSILLAAAILASG
jgi:1,4-dihydroxy-2-naphthoate polyprenyltransferase